MQNTPKSNHREASKMYFLLWEVVIAIAVLIGNKIMKKLEPDNMWYKWYALCSWLLMTAVNLCIVIYG